MRPKLGGKKRECGTKIAALCGERRCVEERAREGERERDRRDNEVRGLSRLINANRRLSERQREGGVLVISLQERANSAKERMRKRAVLGQGRATVTPSNLTERTARFQTSHLACPSVGTVSVPNLSARAEK